MGVNENSEIVSIMLVPSDMVSAQTKLMHQIDQFQNVQVSNRAIGARKTIHDVCTVVQDMLKEVEAQEPRFISSLTEINGRFDGLRVISPTEYEVVLYLNQMGEFNFVDDGSMPGCGVLKLSDGRKRSMSLWVEFITASGYLSARKIRCRFQTLVAQACDKSSYRDSVKMMNDASEVKIRIREKYVVQITPAFKCNGVWPRSAAQWPSMTMTWPHPNMAAQVKMEGAPGRRSSPSSRPSGTGTLTFRATLCQCSCCKPWCSMSVRSIPERRTGRRRTSETEPVGF